MSMKVLSRTFLGENSFLTYPHSNGYAYGGEGLVYMQLCEGRNCLFLRSLASGATRLLVDLGEGKRGGAWDVAHRAGNRLAIVMDRRAWILDLDGPGELVCIFETPGSAKLDGLCSLSGDGRRLLCRLSEGGLNIAIEIDVETGSVRRLFSKDWHANHMHYCPHDEDWVAFSHEGWTEDIPDRCWVWHADLAPEGRLAFNQDSEVAGVKLCVGHERWCFHDASGYAVAYAHSPAGKRGLYEIFADGRPARLVWESNVLWHCTMDRSGRFVAADTTGPIRDEPHSEAEYRKYLELFMTKDDANEPMDIEVVLRDLKLGETLFLAEARWHKHPYHPHPAVSPDARWVAWNDFNPDRRGVWLAEVDLQLGE